MKISQNVETPEDLKNFRAPLGAFQLIKAELAEIIIIVLVASVIVFGVIPDLHLWFQGKPPVKGCKPN